MAASGGSILGELKARMDALTEETTNAPRPFATIAALEDRVAELSAFHDDTSPPSKPKARAFEEGPPKVDSPPDIVDLASAPPSIGSVSGSEEDEEDEEDASEAEQDLSDAEATEPKQKPDGSDPVPVRSGLRRLTMQRVEAGCQPSTVDLLFHVLSNSDLIRISAGRAT